MKTKIPFSFIPIKTLRKISSIFFGLGNKLARNLPMLKLNLDRAEMKIAPQDYIAMSLTSSLIFFVAIIGGIKLLDVGVAFLSNYIVGYDNILPVIVFTLIFISIIINSYIRMLFGAS